MAELRWPKSFAVASALPEKEVGQLIEALIAALDLRGGDIDLEDSETSQWLVDDRGRWIGFDPPRGALHEDDEPTYPEWHTVPSAEQNTGQLWPVTKDGLPLSAHDDEEDDDPAGGSADDVGEDVGIFATKPIYGIDQTKGPTNKTEAVQEHQAKELGLIRTERGTWRRA